jgi:hypothetical protein
MFFKTFGVFVVFCSISGKSKQKKRKQRNLNFYLFLSLPFWKVVPSAFVFVFLCCFSLCESPPLVSSVRFFCFCYLWFSLLGLSCVFCVVFILCLSYDFYTHPEQSCFLYFVPFVFFQFCVFPSMDLCPGFPHQWACVRYYF